MADNLGWTEGSGKSIATKEIGGAHWQMVFAVGGNISIASAGFTVTDNPQVALPTSPLTDRKRVMIQNRSTTHSIFVGPTGVSTTSGLEIPPGWTQTLELGAAVTVYGIAASGGSCNVRVFEIA